MAVARPAFLDDHASTPGPDDRTAVVISLAAYDQSSAGLQWLRHHLIQGLTSSVSQLCCKVVHWGPDEALRTAGLFGGALVVTADAQDLAALVQLEGSTARASVTADSVLAPMERVRLLQIETSRPEVDLPPAEKFSVLALAQHFGVVREVWPLHDLGDWERLSAVWYFWRPPVDGIRDYLGVSQANYFLFLHQAMRWFGPFGVFGGIMTLYSSGTAPAPALVPVLLGVAAIVCTAFVQAWKRSLATARYRWTGSTRIKSERRHIPTQFLFRTLGSSPRAADLDAAAAGTAPPAAPRAHPTAPLPLLLECRRLAATAGVAAMVATTVSTVSALLAFQDFVTVHAARYATPEMQWLLTGSPILLYLCVTIPLQLGWDWVAERLTRLEHHAAFSEFERSLVFKKALFCLVNSMGWFVWVAFVQRDLAYLRSQLTIFMVCKQYPKIVVLKMLVPWVMSKKKAAAGPATLRDRALGSGVAGAAGHFDAYMEVAVIFACVAMFVVVFPGVAVLAALALILELKAEAFQVLRIQRRPMPVDDSASVLVWTTVFQVLCVVGIVSSCALLQLTDSGVVEGQDSSLERVVLAVSATVSAVLEYIRHGCAQVAPTQAGTCTSVSASMDRVMMAIAGRFTDACNAEWRGRNLVLLEHLVLLVTAYFSWMVPDVPEELALGEVVASQSKHDGRVQESRKSAVKLGGVDAASAGLGVYRATVVQELTTALAMREHIRAAEFEEVLGRLQSAGQANHHLADLARSAHMEVQRLQDELRTVDEGDPKDIGGRVRFDVEGSS